MMPTDAELLSRLAALGHALPPAAKPVAEFILWRREGNLIFLAGQICERDGVPYPTGVYGKDVDLTLPDRSQRCPSSDSRMVWEFP